MSESVITPDSSVVTLINVFTVEPADQQRLVEIWQRSTDETIRHLPGFVSANIHRSLDGSKVINYAQWESREAFIAMVNDPDAAAWLTQLAEIGTPAPALCDVVSVHRSAVARRVALFHLARRAPRRSGRAEAVSSQGLRAPEEATYSTRRSQPRRSTGPSPTSAGSTSS